MDTILELKEITQSFNERKILDSLNYSFSNGIYVISGRSGIGKTTLLNIISGYLKPDSGVIESNDLYKIGYCMQEDLSFGNLSVKENLDLKCIALKKNMVNEVTITDVLSKFHIETLMERKVSSLSGGEKQRLKMAMMLFEEPSIILLDEPTSMLDDENKNEVVNIIERVWGDKLLIISSHDDLVFSKEDIKLNLKEGKLYEK